MTIDSIKISKNTRKILKYSTIIVLMGLLIYGLFKGVQFLKKARSNNKDVNKQITSQTPGIDYSNLEEVSITYTNGPVPMSSAYTLNIVENSIDCDGILDVKLRSDEIDDLSKIFEKYRPWEYSPEFSQEQQDYYDNLNCLDCGPGYHTKLTFKYPDRKLTWGAFEDWTNIENFSDELSKVVRGVCGSTFVATSYRSYYDYTFLYFNDITRAPSDDFNIYFKRNEKFIPVTKLLFEDESVIQPDTTGCIVGHEEDGPYKEYIVLRIKESDGDSSTRDPYYYLFFNENGEYLCESTHCFKSLDWLQFDCTEDTITEMKSEWDSTTGERKIVKTDTYILKDGYFTKE